MTYIKDMIYYLGDNYKKGDIIITATGLAKIVGIKRNIYQFFKRYNHLMRLIIKDSKRGVMLTSDGYTYYKKLKLTYEPNIKHSVICDKDELHKEKLKNELQAHVDKITQ